MIEFVFGRDPGARTEHIIARMMESLESGKKAVLLIPEHQALFWDKLCASRFSPMDAFNIETVSFTRLADSVFRRFGGTAKKYVGDSEKLLLMWSAVNAVRESLRAFTACDREDRYAPLLLGARSEIKLYGIGDGELTEAAEKLSGERGSLSARLHDLALISSAYDSILHASFDDPEEIPDALADCLESNVYFENTAVFMDSFYTLTPKEMKVVRLIMKQADSFCATFAMDREDRHLPHTQFVFDYVKDMARTASSLGFDIVSTHTPDARREEFAYLSRALWDYSRAPFEQESDAVTVLKCPDRYDEATLAAERIKALAAGGASFGDIACVAADFEPLRGITDTELERCGIPVYVAGRTAVTHESAARLLMTAAATVAGGWKREDLINAARTGLCSLTPDETDALEMYTDKWRIRGKNAFCAPDGWEMNADGYSDSQSKWGRELLRLANCAKEKLIPPIEAFSEAFPGKMTDVCAAAHKLLCDFSVYESLKKEVSLLESEGKLADAQKKSQVWDALMRMLDILAGCVPDGEVDAARFVSLIRRIGDTVTIGTIPDGIDRVSLGSVGSVRLDNIKHLIVLGAKSGEFPRVPREDGFFSDNDKRLLSKVGLAISPDCASKQKEELFRFSETVCSPKETLTLIIPADGAECHPSLGALRLLKLFPKARVLDFTRPEGGELIRKAARADSLMGMGPLSADGDRVTGEALNRLFDRDISLTQSRIECFTSCAFSYYCKYILKLDDGQAAELKSAEVGTFVHAILEDLMREICEKDAFPAPEEELSAICDRLIAEYKERVLPKSEDGYTDYIFQRLTKSIKLFARSLNEEFAQSRFRPYGFELPVGFSDELPCESRPLENGHSLTVRGIVDRMDILREGSSVYIRVADYKTGSKSFSLKDVLKGHNIQLLLYLFSICNMPADCAYRKKLAPSGERLVPAGAVYFSARPGDILSDGLLSDESAESFALDAISRTGIVLGDREIISAMDRDISGRYAPVTVSAKDDLKGSFAESEKSFKEIENTLNEFLCGVGNSLVGGRAASEPVGYKSSSPCQFCSMLPLCRHNEHAPLSKQKNERKGDEDRE